jgi:anthranilate 1,2-dioxygenase small subunit
VTGGEAREAIAALMAEYAHRLDRDELEGWVELFTEDCLYKILPRENFVQGLPSALILCNNKNMMHDRVKALRDAVEFNIHTDKHVTGSLRITKLSDTEYRADSNYALFQTDQEGESRLFGVGTYEDRIVFKNGKPLFKERIVILDTFAVPNLLSTPI